MVETPGRPDDAIPVKRVDRAPLRSLSDEECARLRFNNTILTLVEDTISRASRFRGVEFKKLAEEIVHGLALLYIWKKKERSMPDGLSGIAISLADAEVILEKMGFHRGEIIWPQEYFGEGIRAPATKQREIAIRAAVTDRQISDVSIGSEEISAIPSLPTSEPAEVETEEERRQAEADARADARREKERIKAETARAERLKAKERKRKVAEADTNRTQQAEAIDGGATAEATLVAEQTGGGEERGHGVGEEEKKAQLAVVYTDREVGDSLVGDLERREGSTEEEGQAIRETSLNLLLFLCEKALNDEALLNNLLTFTKRMCQEHIPQKNTRYLVINWLREKKYIGRNPGGRPAAIQYYWIWANLPASWKEEVNKKFPKLFEKFNLDVVEGDDGGSDERSAKEFYDDVHEGHTRELFVLFLGENFKVTSELLANWKREKGYDYQTWNIFTNWLERKEYVISSGQSTGKFFVWNLEKIPQSWREEIGAKKQKGGLSIEERLQHFYPESEKWWGPVSQLYHQTEGGVFYSYQQTPGFFLNLDDKSKPVTYYKSLGITDSVDVVRLMRWLRRNCLDSEDLGGGVTWYDWKKDFLK
jgi:hypothetical protein